MIRRRALALLLSLVVALGVLVAQPVEAARDFESSGADQFFSVDSAPATAAPLTMACWFRAESSAANQTAMWIGDKDVTNHYFALRFSAGNVLFATAQAGAGNSASTSNAFTDGAWSHACGVFASSTDRRAFINGTGKGTDVNARTPLGSDRIAVGRLAASTPSESFDGLVAHAAAWSAVLSDDEVAALAAGAHPYTIQRASLVFYAPLAGDASPEIDLVGRLALTVGGDPVKAEGISLRGGFAR